MMALAADPTPSPELVAANEAFVAAHQDEMSAIIARAQGLGFMIDPNPPAAG